MISILDYQLSYLELFGSIFNLLAIILAARSSIWNWPISLFSQFFFFLLFINNQLYGNTILQIYFTGISLYGWYNWNKKDGKLIKTLSLKIILISVVVLLLCCLIGGYVLSYFEKGYPYLDAIVTILSMVALLGLTRKILESWYLWIITDILSVYLYYMKGLYLLSFEYILISGIAVMGLIYWKNLYRR